MKSKGAPQKSKTGRHLDYNWECLFRDDIYRQRVLGTESGASNFIQTDDKKQLSVLSMIIYIILILSAMNFVWKGGVIESKFVVTRAVEQWVSNRHFDLMMTPKSFSDINHLDHVKAWLRYALPVIIAPPVEQANFPLYGVRFSLRNVQAFNNTEPRFRELAQVTWKDKVGIDISAGSTLSSFTGGYSNDDTESFGAFREYGFNSDAAQRVFSGLATQDEIRSFSLGLQWCSATVSTCSGDLLSNHFYDRSKNSTQIIEACNLRCEQMESKGRLCHCWTLTSTHCDFYYVPQTLLQSSPPTNNPCWNHTNGVNVYPTLTSPTNGRTSYFPLMKRFVHTETTSSSGGNFAEAYGSSKGFLQGLNFWTQDQVDNLVALQRSLSNSDVGTTPSSQGLLYQQLNDWILGGFLGPTTGYLVVDWMNWNPNHDIVSWVVLKFKADASGLITTGRSINHLVFPQDDLNLLRSDPNSFFWPGFNVWHALYILLVAYYVVKEFYELITSGLRYFTGWQLVVDVGLLLHIAVIGLRYYHHKTSNFTKGLATPTQGEDVNLNIAVFEQEACFALLSNKGYERGLRDFLWQGYDLLGLSLTRMLNKCW